MTTEFFNLNSIVFDFRRGVEELRCFMKNATGPIVLHLSQNFSTIEHLPHRELLSTFSEGILIDRGNFIFELLDDYTRFQWPIVFYTDVSLSGILSEMALLSDYFIASNSSVTLHLTRFKGFSPASYLPLELFARFGAKALNWFLLEAKFSYHELCELGLTQGIYHINWIKNASLFKKTHKTLSAFHHVELRFVLSRLRKNILKGGCIDPLLQLSFIDLIDRISMTPKDVLKEHFAQYFYECSIAHEYRAGLLQLNNFPQGVLHSLYFKGIDFSFASHLLAKFLAARVTAKVSVENEREIDAVFSMLREYKQPFNRDGFVFVTSNADGVLISEENLLGVNFLLGDGVRTY